MFKSTRASFIINNASQISIFARDRSLNDSLEPVDKFSCAIERDGYAIAIRHAGSYICSGNEMFVTLKTT